MPRISNSQPGFVLTEHMLKIHLVLMSSHATEPSSTCVKKNLYVFPAGGILQPLNYQLHLQYWKGKFNLHPTPIDTLCCIHVFREIFSEISSSFVNVLLCLQKKIHLDMPASYANTHSSSYMWKYLFYTQIGTNRSEAAPDTKQGGGNELVGGGVPFFFPVAAAMRRSSVQHPAGSALLHTLPCCTSLLVLSNFFS